MFDSETRWFIRCDTCPDDDARTTLGYDDKDELASSARFAGWEIRDDLHRCPQCLRQGRTEMAT